MCDVVSAGAAVYAEETAFVLICMHVSLLCVHYGSSVERLDSGPYSVVSAGVGARIGGEVFLPFSVGLVYTAGRRRRTTRCRVIYTGPGVSA